MATWVSLLTGKTATMHWIIVGILIWIGLAVAPIVIVGGIIILRFLALFLIAGAIGAWIGAPNNIGPGAIFGVGLALLLMWIGKLLGWLRQPASERRKIAAKRREEEAAYREQFRPRA
jgi:hypothetical protein